MNLDNPLNPKLVIPAQAGIQRNKQPATRTKSCYRPAAQDFFDQLDSRLRGNDSSIELFRMKQLSAQRGFSYVEVLLAVILLAVLLVPAMQALNTAIMGSTSNLADRQLKLRSKMEAVLSKPYNTLYAETSLTGGNTTTSISANYSDLAGAADRRVVVLYRFNTTTNVLSATDTGVLFVSVYYEAEGSANALNTLVGRWW